MSVSEQQISNIQKQVLHEWNELNFNNQQEVFDNLLLFGAEGIAAKIAGEESIPMAEARVYANCLWGLARDRFCGTIIDFFQT